MPVSWAGMMGAGDGNRTRTVSLGMSAGPALTGSSAGRWPRRWSVRTHEARLFTGPSGTRQGWPWLDTVPTWSPELGRLTGSSPTQTT
jgi:hypothetical protein